MSGTEAARAIIETARGAPFAGDRRRSLIAFLEAAETLEEVTLGADAFAVELRAELEVQLENLNRADQAGRYSQLTLLGKE